MRHLKLNPLVLALWVRFVEHQPILAESPAQGADSILDRGNATSALRVALPAPAPWMASRGHCHAPWILIVSKHRSQRRVSFS